MIDFAKLHEQLPHGAQTEIAKRAGVHFSLVYRVLRGKSSNQLVLNTIADYLEEFKEQQASSMNKISALIAD